MALLSGVFSVNVNAAELDTVPYQIYTTSYMVYGDDRWDLFGTLLSIPNNGEVEKSDETGLVVWQHEYNSHNGHVHNVIYYDIANINQTSMFEGGIKTTVKLENIYHRYLYSCRQDGQQAYFWDVSWAAVRVDYIDGTSETISCDFTAKSGDLDMKFTFTPQKDVLRLSFVVDVPMTFLANHSNHTESVFIMSYMGEFNGDDKYNLTIQQPSEEAGLLEGIWGQLTSGFNALGDKLSGVWSAITDGFSNMGNKLTDVFNSIVELPSKIWGFIENGLKSLFVPSEEKIVDMKSQWEELLSSKYGAVWEVVQITFGSWENINANDQKNSISVPEVEIPLPDGQSFSFGGEEVQVVPSGFETIAEICKMATGAFCTLMFINGLRKRYDEVMAVEQ